MHDSEGGVLLHPCAPSRCDLRDTPHYQGFQGFVLE